MTFFKDSGPRLAAIAVALLAALLPACQKSKTGFGSDSQIDACALFSQGEIQGVQGAPVRDVKSTSNTNGGFRTSDCLFTSEIKDHSVSVALVQRNAGSPNGRDPKEYWQISFGRYVKEKTPNREAGSDEQKPETAGEREKEQDRVVPPPKKIDGLGDAAFWATSLNGGGALYVLKGNAFIRISIAGPENEDSKIDQCKALAAKALARF